MEDRIKKLQKKVLELELANVDEFAKRSYLNAFDRMNIDSEESFDKYIDDVRCELKLSGGSENQTPEQIKEIARDVVNNLF